MFHTCTVRRCCQGKRYILSYSRGSTLNPAGFFLTGYRIPDLPFTSKSALSLPVHSTDRKTAASHTTLAPNHCPSPSLPPGFSLFNSSTKRRYLSSFFVNPDLDCAVLFIAILRLYHCDLDLSSTPIRASTQSGESLRFRTLCHQGIVLLSVQIVHRAS